eukprot:TRINITY_DN3828_c2_g1_i1.p1 TRINITY_DN3828_c2_g1~~TRINITY_DN3828_c2_g1_i1.p1  ORF type:complete len:312 (+),score=53.09 TRINITY_DN3828_c2_g1_i1:57-938(+)
MDKLQNASDAIDSVVTEQNIARVQKGLRGVEVVAGWASQHAELCDFVMQIGILLYGPLFANTSNLVRSIRGPGFDQVRESYKGLKEEYWHFRDTKEKEGGTVTLAVIIEAVDPHKLEKLGKGLVFGIFSSLCLLQSPNCQLLQCAASMGNQFTAVTTAYVEPLLLKCIANLEERRPSFPKGTGKWAALGVRASCYFIAQRLISLVQSPVIVATAISEAAENITETIVKRYPDLVPYKQYLKLTLMGIGLANVFAFRGHKNLPSPLRFALYIPLKVESFVSVVPGVAQSFGIIG